MKTDVCVCINEFGFRSTVVEFILFSFYMYNKQNYQLCVFTNDKFDVTF